MHREDDIGNVVWVRLRSANSVNPVFRNVGVNDQVADVYAVRPKFSRQHLRECTLAKLADGKVQVSLTAQYRRR